jgi:hypothetical protein
MIRKIRVVRCESLPGAVVLLLFLLTFSFSFRGKKSAEDDSTQRLTFGRRKKNI